GSDDDLGSAIALTAPNCVANCGAFVTGITASTDFGGVAGGSAQNASGGNQDGFVVALTSVGTLTYASYLGGSADDFPFAIAIDSSGRAYVAGQTQSLNFPISGGFQTSTSDAFDAFVTKVNSTGTGFTY